MKPFYAIFFMLSVLLLSGCSELRKSEEKIKSEILGHISWGSDISDVLGFLEAKNIEVRSVNRSCGFYDQRVKPAKETGKMSIRANFGDYREFFFLTNVTVYFAFDGDGKLFDIWVWKTTDAP